MAILKPQYRRRSPRLLNEPLHAGKKLRSGKVIEPWTLGKEQNRLRGVTKRRKELKKRSVRSLDQGMLRRKLTSYSQTTEDPISISQAASRVTASGLWTLASCIQQVHAEACIGQAATTLDSFVRRWCYRSSQDDREATSRPP